MLTGEGISSTAVWGTTSDRRSSACSLIHCPLGCSERSWHSPSYHPTYQRGCSEPGPRCLTLLLSPDISKKKSENRLIQTLEPVIFLSVEVEPGSLFLMLSSTVPLGQTYCRYIFNGLSQISHYHVPNFGLFVCDDKQTDGRTDGRKCLKWSKWPLKPKWRASCFV